VVDHSTFTGNLALGSVAGAVLGSGGGALTSYGGSTLTVTSSTFASNRLQDPVADGGGGSGGALDCQVFGDLAHASSTLTVAGCSFSGNQAIGGNGAPGGDGGQGNGGAISLGGPGSTSASVTGSSFTDNLARSGDGDAGGGSGALSFGGAINNFSA